MLGVLASCSRVGSFQPVILGEVLVGSSGDSAPSSAKQARSIWITLGVDSLAESEDSDNISTPAIRKPRLLSLYSLGCRYDTSCYMFGYTPAATSALECFHVDRERSLGSFSQSETASRNNQISRNSGTSALTSTDLELIVNQMNAAEDVRSRLLFAIEHSKPGNRQPVNVDGLFYTADNPYESYTERTLHGAATALCAILEKPGLIWCRVLKQSVKSINHKYMLLRLGLGISNWLGITTPGVAEFSSRSAGLAGNIGGNSNNKSNIKSSVGVAGNTANSPVSPGISWRDLSLSFAYIHERSSRTLLALQMCGQFAATWCFPASFKQYLHTEVMSLVCTMVVDMLLGVVFGVFLFTHAEWIVSSLGVVCAKLQHALIIRALEWFNHSPIGIKLNPFITQRMGALLGAVVREFNDILRLSAPVHVMIVRLVACMGCHGMSVQLVLVVDFLRLLTFHIATIHRVLSSWHHFMLECLHSLWLLFQGQKNNILRRRVDTCYYEPDQLLFGIVLFSIAFFLFPNFAAYFLLFALAQLGCVKVQYVVYSLSVAVKEFPYYAAALFVVCPGAQTDGVQFKVLDNRAPRTHAPASPQGPGAGVNTSLQAMQASGAQRSVTASRATLSSWLRDSARGVPQVRSEQPRHPRSESRRMRTADRDGTITASSNTTNTGSSGRSDAGLRGILKPASDSSALLPVETVSSEPGRARVSFLKGIVRTITSYHSDDTHSALSTAESDESVELRDATTSAQDKETEGAPLNLVSLRGPTRRQQLTMHSQDASSSTGGSNALARVEKVAYIELSARMLPKTRLFAGYMNHLFYFSYEKGLLVRLVRGVVYGRPALDIQMIHGTCDISDRREAAAKAEMASMLRVMQQTRREQGSYAWSSTAISSEGELTYPEIIRVAMAGKDESVGLLTRQPMSPTSPSGESDALLGSSQDRSSLQRVPHSRACRKFSRLMLLALLSAMMLQVVMCLLCSAFFVRAFFLEWRRYHPYGAAGVLRRSTLSVSAMDTSVNLTDLEGPPSCASVDSFRVHTDSLIF